MLNRNHELSLGNTLYPSPTAGTGKLDTDKYTGVPDSYAGKCCGWRSDPKRVGNPGTINEGDGDITFLSVTGGSEPIVGSAGCPFCGSGNSR